MSSRKTMREAFASTVVENGTVREDQGTVRDGGRAPASPAAGESIGGFRVKRQLPTMGSEADVYIVAAGDEEKVLKLYRYGLEPKQEILDRYKAISGEFPEHVVRVDATGRDDRTGRWYELLEFVRYGSVADWFEKKGHFDFNTFVRELGSAVNALHERGIIHRDLKPGNILVRSPEPLDLVLTDFGIASVLDGGMSLRETSHSGFTPMYAAPEDLDGVIVSAPADWWACGMIFLEALTGSHPFRGLPVRRIAYFLSTRGVEIDSRLPERQQRLLKGLLTRNDKKRWGWRQIQAWLAGDDDIALYYEEPEKGAFATPFRFLGKSYDSPRDMSLSFASGLEEWKAGRGTLGRGNIAKWLRDNHEFDEERIVSEELADNNPDLYLARFIAHYAPELPPNIFGVELSASNLLALLARPERELAENERSAINFILQKGALLALLQIYANAPGGDDGVLRAVAMRDWRSPEELRKNLLALLSPEIFYWGPIIPEKFEDRMDFLKRTPDILTSKSWEEMEGPQLLLPPAVKALFDKGRYADAIAELSARKKDNSLLYKKDAPRGRVIEDEAGYVRLVGEKHGLNRRALDLLEKTRKLADKIESGSGDSEVRLNREVAMIKDYCTAIMTGRKVWQEQDYELVRMIYERLRTISTSSKDLHRKFFTSPLVILGAVIGVVFSYMLTAGLGYAVADWLTSSSFETAALVVAVIGAVLGYGVAENFGGAILGFLGFGFVMGLIRYAAPAVPIIFLVALVCLLILFGRSWSRRKLASIRDEKPVLLDEIRRLLLRLYGERVQARKQ